MLGCTMTSGIQRLQATQYEASLSNQAHQEEGVDRALERHEQCVETGYQQSLVEIEKSKEARETQSLATLLGTVFGGLLVGTAVGSAIGGALNDGDEAAAREAKKQTDIAGMEADKAFDQFQDLRGEIEDSQSRERDVQKLARELRDGAWIGTQS